MTTRTLTLLVALSLAAHAAENPTFHRDVLPLLQKRCQSCHRPGESAPMSLLTYQQTRPLAKAIKQAVITKKMPPWFADPAVGKFSNDRSLAPSEIETLVRWADTNAPEGDPKDAPAPRQFVTGWTIGTPDFVLEMPTPFEVPARGVVDYQWIRMVTGFTEDKWIQAIEFRPGERSVVHHILGVVRNKDSEWMKDVAPGVAIAKPPGSSETGMSNGILGDYVPGMPGLTFAPGSAMLLPAGADILFQVHYTPNGKAARDRSKVGIIFARQRPTERVLNLAVSNGRFKIPPRDPDYRVDAAVTFGIPVRVLTFNPHMHLRGKSMEGRAVLPDGTSVDLVRVPRYDFNWQLTYEVDGERTLPAGTRLEATGRFDNSAHNRHNPDPDKEVSFGDQTTDEMMVLFTHVVVPVDTDLRRLYLRTPPRPAAYQNPGSESQFAAAVAER